MDDDAAQARRDATRLLVGILAALFLAATALAGTGQAPDEDKNAAKVARKVEKALEKARKAEAEPLEEDREALAKFQEQVTEYAELHDKQAEKLPGDATGLARALQSKRRAARQGDVFATAVEGVFRRLIAAELRGSEGLSARQAVAEGNPGEERPAVRVVVRVNGEYATGAPRSTVPASVLATLPPLPECLHYRFVGRNLVLVDSVAQIIVDFLPAAAPVLSVE